MFEKRAGWKGRSVWLLGAMLAVSGCSKETQSTEASEGSAFQSEARAEQGSTTSTLSALPTVEGLSTARVFVQRLEQPTALKETTAVHVKLAPPANSELADSLVRVVGRPSDPVVLFRSDTLAELGVIPQSPGSEYFTLFSSLTDEELERRVASEQEVDSGRWGEITRENILFNGRQPAARFEGLPLQAEVFRGGGMIPIANCPAMPATTQALWDRALLIRDPLVVQDPARTWDPCTNLGTRGGVWTFAHLMRQMATNSGVPPETFVLKWLSSWLNDYTVNNDVVDQRRQQMFDQVIQPWAVASGGAAFLTQVGATWQVAIAGNLDLDIAPFRLLAIVNRIDLAGNTGGGYGGSSTSGELRFVFGMTQPTAWGVPGGTQATCNLKPFTTIVEYGVPRAGCRQVIDYARQWAELGTHASFDAAYLTKLEAITQSVVLAGKAPTKGNGNALNQLRTNEIALAPTGGKWELREFQLADEDSNAGTTTPNNGLLRPHTVALTPNDATHNAQTDPDVNTQVVGPVLAGITTSPTIIPSACVSSFTVPHKVNGNPFLGGHAQVNPPTHWEAFSVTPFVPEPVCARKEFSANTCNGCHFGDTALNGTNGNNAFMHISATSGIPATPSKFLTGGGVGFMFSVPDQQFPGLTSWPFADLLRRHQRLYDIATCQTCSPFLAFDSGFLAEMERMTGVVPFDELAGSSEGDSFNVGPIRDLEQVKRLFESRSSFAKEPRDLSLNFLRPPETFVH
ncbi:hypothetical protein JYJ95_25090 [Corallococcus exiguus]|uniref:hypothetical protein n=1 Tax=Corallococcus exiguus TaxID=83462 RepID=UPI001A90C105|nr:hypothetical protein [Corallococcus exiguus]MBN8469796.1 hypothetical protein [Corallococcus exiguus]